MGYGVIFCTESCLPGPAGHFRCRHLVGGTPPYGSDVGCAGSNDLVSWSRPEHAQRDMERSRAGLLCHRMARPRNLGKLLVDLYYRRSEQGNPTEGPCRF